MFKLECTELFIWCTRSAKTCPCILCTPWLFCPYFCLMDHLRAGCWKAMISRLGVMVRKYMESQELLTSLLHSWITARGTKVPIKGFAGSFNTAARPGAAQGRPCAGLGCPWDALDEVGIQPVAGRQGWEGEQALWDILFIFLWLQGSRLGQRNPLVCPQPLITSPVSL